MASTAMHDCTIEAARAWPIMANSKATKRSPSSAVQQRMQIDLSVKRLGSFD